MFFNTSGKGVSHVGVYVGDGKFAHASSSKGVIISSLSEKYYVKRYVGAKRVLSTDKYEDVTGEVSDHDDVE
ncbi:Murein DD-endopeptidase MepS/Murein LD-carboxypeptidase precursor [compost metagenome]